jgi:transposase-like protein
MTAEQIAADVAARYGMPVMPNAVQVCPPATFTWQLEGKDDNPPTWEEMKKTYYKNRARVHRVTKSAMPKVNELKLEIVRLYLAGDNQAEISRKTGASRRTVGNKIREAGVYDPQRSKDDIAKINAVSNKARAEAKKAKLAAHVAQTQDNACTGRVGEVSYAAGGES